MSKLSLLEIAQSQLDKTPVIDGQLIVCLDTGNAYRDTATAHVKIGSGLEVVSDLPLAPLAEKIYYLKPDKLYAYLGGNWTLLNDKTIDLDKVIAKLPAGSSTALNDDVEIITQDTDTTQAHYYRRKLVVIWEYIKTKAQDFFAAKNHKHKKADITDFPTSMPASDVYPWAKAAKKPSYTKAEIGLGKVDNTADADKTVKRATTAGTADSANSVAWENVKDKPTTFPVEAHTHDDRYYTETEINAKLDGKSNTGHTHDDRYYTEAEINTKLNGKAPNEHTHQYLSLYEARPANINFTKSTNGTGAMFHFVATSSTTTGKPPADSSILQLNWDNSGGWDSQLALSTTANPHVYYRNQQNGTWGNWSTLLDNLNYTDYVAKKEHTHTKSQITDFPASLKNPTALTIQTNGTTAVIYDGSAAKTVNITKGNIGLGNVDNTADANKSVKYATSAGNASKVNNHTVNIDVPANAKFTDTTYGVATASSNGLMSSTDKTKLDDFSRVISIQKQIKLTTDWQDTGIAGNNLETGTYVVQVSGFNASYTSLYSETYSGIMTWYASETNSDNYSEIFLHNAGHADNSNAIYLRTSRRAYGNGGLHLQIACKVAASGTDTLTFKFRRLI